MGLETPAAREARRGLRLLGSLTTNRGGATAAPGRWRVFVAGEPSADSICHTCSVTLSLPALQTARN